MKSEKLQIEQSDSKIAYVARDDCKFEFMRSSGKGGQNVNKTETKVRAIIAIGSLKNLDQIAKDRIRTQWQNRIHDDKLSVVIQTERSRERNIEIALKTLNDMIAKALEPHKERIPTEPPETSRLRRLEEKRRISLRKQERTKIKDVE